MKTQKRKLVRVFLRFALGFTALALLIRFADLGNVWAAVQSAAGSGIVLAVFLNFATRFSAAARSYALIRATHIPISYLHTVKALFASNFWSLALPGVSAGSVATVWHYRAQGAGLVHSVAILAASRAIELLAFCLLALLGLAMGVHAMNRSRIWVVAVLLGVISALALGLWILHRLPRVGTPVLSDTGADSGGKFGRVVAASGAAVALLRELPRAAVIRASGWALLQGMLDAATVLALALSLGMHVGMAQALWINALSYLAILLPISAVGLGLREAAVLAALLPLGFSQAEALALALLMLGLTLLNALAGGMLQLTASRARQSGRYSSVQVKP